MKLLYGTGNQAKLAAMRSRLRQIGIELVGLNDLKADGLDIPKVVEKKSNRQVKSMRNRCCGFAAEFKGFCVENCLLRVETKWQQTKYRQQSG